MSYKKQFEKVKRYLRKIDPQLGFHGDSIEYEDNLWSFFQNAWHLKDWIKNDASVKKSISMEVAYKNYKSLLVCSDLANRSKHFTLTKTIRVDAKHTRTDVELVVPIDFKELLSRKDRSPLKMQASGSYLNYVFSDSSGNEYRS